VTERTGMARVRAAWSDGRADGVHDRAVLFVWSRVSSSVTDTAATGPRVDPRAPRFGQGITASVLLAAVVAHEPLLVVAVAVLLSTAVASRWRVDLYATLWRRLVTPRLPPSGTTEAATPHRFSKLLGAAFTLVASPLVLAGGAPAVVGYTLAAVVAALAAIAATTGFCLGCRLYGQVRLVQRLDLV
jgi:hypothetical protein